MSTLTRRRPAILTKSWWSRYLASLRFAFYCMVHPFDGFWDLTHEKRGSVAAANTIMFLTLATRILALQYTSFQFMFVNWEYINIIAYSLSVFLPLFVYVIANWCWTTLFDGKGTFKDIYIGLCYAIAPYFIIQIPMILLSNLIIVEEGAFYYIFDVLSLIWCGFLILIAMMEIHDYSLGKTLLFTVMSLFGMLIIIFLLLLFTSLVSDGISFFVSLYREVVFRLF